MGTSWSSEEDDAEVKKPKRVRGGKKTKKPADFFDNFSFENESESDSDIEQEPEPQPEPILMEDKYNEPILKKRNVASKTKTKSVRFAKPKKGTRRKY
jgi:hypothetical protein